MSGREIEWRIRAHFFRNYLLEKGAAHPAPPKTKRLWVEYPARRKMTYSKQEVTQLLVAWSQGDQAAFERLAPLVYEELRCVARRYMRRERAGHTLQTTAVVNEAYLRLIDAGKVQWQNRAHFFAVSAKLMRRILVDYARAHNYIKRGGEAHHVPLEEAAVFSAERAPDIVALDDALKSLAVMDQRKSRVVELRFFGGLSVEETAEALKVSPRTVMNDWNLAKAWLLRELSNRESDETDVSGD